QSPARSAPHATAPECRPAPEYPATAENKRNWNTTGHQVPYDPSPTPPSGSSIPDDASPQQCTAPFPWTCPTPGYATPPQLSHRRALPQWSSPQPSSPQNTGEVWQYVSLIPQPQHQTQYKTAVTAKTWWGYTTLQSQSQSVTPP